MLENIRLMRFLMAAAAGVAFIGAAVGSPDKAEAIVASGDQLSLLGHIQFAAPPLGPQANSGDPASFVFNITNVSLGSAEGTFSLDFGGTYTLSGDAIMTLTNGVSEDKFTFDFNSVLAPPINVFHEWVDTLVQGTASGNTLTSNDVDAFVQSLIDNPGDWDVGSTSTFVPFNNDQTFAEVRTIFSAFNFVSNQDPEIRVSEPAAFALFGLGLAGIAATRQRFV